MTAEQREKYENLIADIDLITLSELGRRALYTGAIEMAADEISCKCFEQAQDWLTHARSTKELKQEALRLINEAIKEEQEFYNCDEEKEISEI